MPPGTTSRPSASTSQSPGRGSTSAPGAATSAIRRPSTTTVAPAPTRGTTPFRMTSRPSTGASSQAGGAPSLTLLNSGRRKCSCEPAVSPGAATMGTSRAGSVRRGWVRGAGAGLLGGRGRRPRLRVHRRPPAHAGLVPCGMRSRPNGRARIHKPAKVTPPIPEGAIPRRRLFAELDSAQAPGARDVGLRPAGLGQDDARRDLARRPPGEAGLAAGGRRRRRARHVLPLPRRRRARGHRRARVAPGAHAGVPAEPGRVRPRLLPAPERAAAPGDGDRPRRLPRGPARRRVLRARCAPGSRSSRRASRSSSSPAAIRRRRWPARGRTGSSRCCRPARSSSLRPRRWPSRAPADWRHGGRRSRRCGVR